MNPGNLWLNLRVEGKFACCTARAAVLTAWHGHSPFCVGRYPEGFGCGTLAHPDLVFLAHLDGVLFDLRVLVVVRDPVAAVMSSVRRFNVKEFTYKNYQFQARAVQEGLTMINNGLAAVPCGKVGFV